MNISQAGLYRQPWPDDGDLRFVQLGIVVTDLLAAAARWAQVHRVGPFHVLPRRTSPATYRGRPIQLEQQIAVAWAGPIQIELIEAFGDDRGVYDEFTDAAATVHQICTVTYDYDTTVDHYERHGYPQIVEMGRDQRVAFMDTYTDFGFYTEIVEASDGFIDALTKIERACATWDGTDPVRLITRDGYRTPDR